jgi:Tfp pilus assembly protein PilO
MQQRDKRALLLLVVAVALFAALQLPVFAPSSGAAAPSNDTLAVLEQRLALAREKAARKPLTEAELASARRALDGMEQRLLTSQNPALAQAEMRSLVGDLLSAEGVAMGSSQFGQVDVEQDSYAMVPLSVDFTCSIEQLVNLTSAIANAPKLLTTRFIRVRPEKPEVKSILVRMTVAGYLPIDRAPELQKKTAAGGTQ